MSRGARTLLVAAGLLAAVARPARADDEDAARLAVIEREFGQVPRADTLRALDALVPGTPTSEPLRRALLWRAQLALVDADRPGAEARFARLLASRPPPDTAALAERGLGDAAFRAGDLDAAERHYRAAVGHPLLAAEVGTKLRLCATARLRRRLAAAALFIYLACAALLLRGALLGPGRPRLPVEVAYALPLVVVLSASARLADRRAVPALACFGAGALVVAALSGAAHLRAADRRRPAALVAQGLVVVVALLALGWFSAWMGDLIDLLGDTFSPESH